MTASSLAGQFYSDGNTTKADPYAQAATSFLKAWQDQVQATPD